jgi:hypothetical protein
VIVSVRKLFVQESFAGITSHPSIPNFVATAKLSVNNMMKIKATAFISS